jgi:hypothetical protein
MFEKLKKIFEKSKKQFENQDASKNLDLIIPKLGI